MRPLKRLSARLHWIWKIRKDTLIIFCGILLTCAVASLYIFQPLVLSSIELKLYDTLLKLPSARNPSGHIVIVDIDEKSLAQYGQWPWPRYRISQLLDKLREMGAASVGVDILFTEPDRSSLQNIQREILSDFHCAISLSGIPPHYLDNDALLAETLRKGPFVLGYQFLFGDHIEKSARLHPVDLLFKRERGVSDSVNGLFKPSSVDGLFQPLSEATPASGFINIKPDHDGIIRRVPLIMEYEGQFYPQLSLAVLLSAAGMGQLVLSVGQAGAESLSFEGIEIPLEEKGSFLIPFRGPRGTYCHLSAADILSGAIGSREIDGRIVFVGATAPGLFDIRATPTDPSMTGVEVHANIIDSILQGDFLLRPKAAVFYEFIALLFFGLLSAILFAHCKAVVNLTFLLLSALTAVLLPVYLFRKGIYISPLYPALAYASNFSLLSFLDFWHGERLLKEKTRLQLATQDAMLETIANITETRDSETGGHIRRTRSYVKALAEHIRNKHAYSETVNDAYIEQLFQSAPLHDLGKVGVPDHILLKPDKLTAEETEEIKKHTVYGKRVIDDAQAKLGDSSFLNLAGEMALYHHEYWDGRGYPTGLKGEEIPLSGRIMAIADVYDALISDRPYKKGFPHEKAVEIILAGRGSQFDPELTDAFGEIHETFKSIAEQFADAGIHESLRSKTRRE
ncbi:MAG: CHASE2 domain-containing protein [Syntrophus sp. (in: bacteria)]|nr:CHASE2 domain-containing protein [Syntrophus sp. (in: bacteria)]